MGWLQDLRDCAERERNEARRHAKLIALLQPIIPLLPSVPAQLQDINTKLELTLMKLSELAPALRTVVQDTFAPLPAQLEKVKQEVIKAIQANNPNDPEVPQGVLDALAGLNAIGAGIKAGVDAIDALNVDEPAPPAPPAQ